jgi:hypothetical protein
MRVTLPILAAASLLLFAACAGATAPTATPTPATAETGPSSPNAHPVIAACAPGAEPRATVYAGWPQPGRAQATGDVIPLVVSSEVTAGPSRFLFSLIDSKNAILAAADVPVTAAFYDLAADPADPVATTDAVFLEPGNGRGLYRASVDFRCAGEWGLVVTAAFPTGAVTSRVVFDVHPAGTIPAIGSQAPRSDSPVATTPDELKAISTDDDPDPDFYRKTVAQAVTSGTPSAILFATPQFCQTQTCGPMLDLVESIAKDFKGKVEFVNVEPYQLRQTDTGLQPLLDEKGHLQPVQAVLDWGLPSEPYLFVVDKDGRIAASFEGILGEDEVRAALLDVSGS